MQIREIEEKRRKAEQRTHEVARRAREAQERAATERLAQHLRTVMEKEAMAEKRSQEAASRAREAQQHAVTERLAQQLAEEEEMARRMMIEKRDEAVRRRWAEMRENLEGGSERVSNCNAGSRNCTHNADKIWWSRKNGRGQYHFCNRVCLKYTFRCPHCVMACVPCKKQQTT